MTVVLDVTTLTRQAARLNSRYTAIITEDRAPAVSPSGAAGTGPS